MMSKTDTYAAVGVGLLLLAGGRKVFAATPPKAGAKPRPDDDGAALMKRANQSGAMAWVARFAAHPVSPLVAAALARWAGLESSGRATVESRLGERGLMQAGPQTVAEGGLTASQWDALKDPTTPPTQHVDMAIQYVDWLAHRAAAHVAEMPDDPIDRIWYAKLYHQRPVDVRDAHMHGPAVAMARALASAWASDSKAMHRLRAANVVAFGTPTP